MYSQRKKNLSPHRMLVHCWQYRYSRAGNIDTPEPGERPDARMTQPKAGNDLHATCSMQQRNKSQTAAATKGKQLEK
jgi:hypothetical protein